MRRSITRGGRQTRRAAAILGLAIAIGCGGCASRPPPPPEAGAADPENDPAEPVNRAIFKANLAADHAVVRPVAQAYVEHVPQAVRQGVHNVVQNLKEPANAVNDLLQGQVTKAWQSVGRLAVNTTAGAGGLVDVAKKWGLPPHRADFGETLAVWGVKEGPFVELPLLGPSSARDAVGAVVDLAMNPLAYVGGPPAAYASIASGGADAVDVRAQHLKDLDDLERNSLDFYAELRSAYRQHRAAEIAAAKAPGEATTAQRQQPAAQAAPQHGPQPVEGRIDLTYPAKAP